MQDGPDRPWQLFRGPLAHDFFQTQLPDPEAGWQLMVNGVDRAVPAVSDLLTDFDMVPRWRIDDVMISFAPAGGTVGPHSDSLDVFLLQGSGTKRWAVDTSRKVQFDDDDAHVPVRFRCFLDAVLTHWQLAVPSFFAASFEPVVKGWCAFVQCMCV